jgi:uncharacterized membrane protein
VTAPERASSRFAAIDLLRGAIMVLMVVDHVRVFAGVPAGGPEPAVFFTRWITHFCAPGFVFFAGAAAFLHGDKLGDRRALSRWLFLRGAWLVFLELTWMRLSWTFNFDYSNYMMAGVLWAIGICMMLLAAAAWLPRAAIAAIGLSFICLHDLVTPHSNAIAASLRGSRFEWLAQVLYLGGAIGPLWILYVIVPWIGVMMAGYAFGPIVKLPAERRRTLCFAIGGAAIAAFLILRGFDLYGDQRPWSAQPPRIPALLRFLNTSKYPASMLFLFMTLGPLIAIAPPIEAARGPIARVLLVFGRAPLFFYLLHVPLIHALALVVSLIRERRLDPWLFENHPMGMSRAPAGYMFSLPLLYLVVAIAVALLYLPCKKYLELKANRRSALLALV